jgi:hypothetical protein
MAAMAKMNTLLTMRSHTSSPRNRKNGMSSTIGTSNGISTSTRRNKPMATRCVHVGKIDASVLYEVNSRGRPRTGPTRVDVLIRAGPRGSRRSRRAG